MVDRVTEYCKDVLNGKIVAGKLVKLAAKRHLDDLEKSKLAPFKYEFDVEKSLDIIDYAETLVIAEGEDPIQVSLYPFQAFILGSLNGWVTKGTGYRRFRTSYIQLARQNGKSFLNGIIGTYYGNFDSYKYGQIYCTATKKDQARIVFDEMVKFINADEELGSNYENIASVLHDLGIEKVDGIYLDLGVSSYQLDTASRGFTYREDAPLDMRMDQRNTQTAADIVNTYSETELYHIIRDYGEDRFAKNIAKHIVQRRQEKPYETTGELIETIKAAIPAKIRATGGHPAKRTFQAIRIELNHELDVLNRSIDTMIDLLNPGGRLSIITFHSLEDRIVKKRFRYNENPCIGPPEFPVCMCGRKSKGTVITRKPIVPGEEEFEYNKRSKSSKLRVFERA